MRGLQARSLSRRMGLKSKGWSLSELERDLQAGFRIDQSVKETFFGITKVNTDLTVEITDLALTITNSRARPSLIRPGVSVVTRATVRPASDSTSQPSMLWRPPSLASHPPSVILQLPSSS